MGWCEVSRGAGSDIASGRPGDFGWYVLTSADPEAKQKKLNAELANGRLAMMAIIGMFYQDGLTGSAWGDWANFTDSPLRAADFSTELGVTPPLGFWDPLGLSKFDDPEIDAQQFRRRRIVELQHGRVAMLACIGYIVPEYFRFPGFCAPSQSLAFTDIPNGLKGAAAVPLAGWLQIVTFVGIIEVYNLQTIQNDVLGDYGYGAFGLPFGKKIEDAEKKTKSLNAEINNGRLAMMAIIGMFFQDGLTGSAWGDWANYADSPLRAADFSTELGVTPPLGFWDPLGLSKFDDPEIAAQQFRRRRIVELQHGRVAMLACIGYIVPEYFRFPGFCAPSQSLAFTDIPNGLKGAAAVPLAGWLQIVTFVGIIEVYNLQTIQNDVLGDYGYGAFGLPFGKKIEDAEKKTKSLNAEINNGRLAMMAIIGMFFQDGLTGSAWGDWANYADSPLRAADFSTELGVTPPLGFWDPLGLSKFDDPEIAAQQFRRRRIVELQHGRVAMLACIGYIVPEYFRFPGFCAPSQSLAFTDIPNGLKGAAAVPLAGWLQIVTFVGIIEVYNLQTIQNDVLGDYGYGAFGLPFGKKIEDAEKKTKSLNAEINNGRLAMMAIIGMFFQDGLTGSAWGDWANYADSPLRAADFSTELGVTPPLGFWDPLGLSKFDDPEIAAQQFRRRRIVELQHGRVAMLACIGYIVPEYFRFPGFCAPSQSLAFTDIPNGLKGAAAVPLAGWLQIVTFVGIIEVYNLQTIQNDVLGDYGYGAFGLPFGKKIEDAEKKTKSLNAEINNGRLAMMAIIGMFFQDGLTGSAWGDWANYADSPLRASR
ncbi:FCPB [Symbiodinium natans]|uniref:FCPB protein n=1 Tax=Symbiodinium natans TaxID=878477 RepID=A0A812S3A8_9DINO|nr:FCPB [Symbiodinium natans]